MMGGHGGSFLGTAAATVAGVVGGAMLLNGIRSAFGGGGGNQAFGGGFGPSPSPWGGGSDGGALSRDAGVGDIGRPHRDDPLARQDALQDAQQDLEDDDRADDAAADAADYDATTAAISVTAAAATSKRIVGRARPSLLPPRLRGGPGWGSSSPD